MSTQNLVPRNDGSGSIGIPTKKWGSGSFSTLQVDSATMTGSFSGDGSGLTGVSATLPSGVVSGSSQLDGSSFTGSFTGSLNGVDIEGGGAATAFLNQAGDYISLVAEPANAVLISAKVNESVGIVAGQIVYITGAVGGSPQVALADKVDIVKSDVLGIAIETKTDGQTIQICTSGLVQNVDTSGFTAGDIIYLGTSGSITPAHPTGIDAVQRVGHVVKVNVSTGNLIVERDPLTAVNDHDGIMRYTIANLNTGSFASSAFTLINNAYQRSSISMVGSNYSTVPNISSSLAIYNEGYNNTINAVDGNFGFEWWTDVTDSHNLSSTSKMALSAVGNLNVVGSITSSAFAGDGSGLTNVTATPTIPATTRISSSYTVLSTDYRIGILYSLTGSLNIQLPLVSDVSATTEYKFKDEEGNALQYNQHIMASGSDVIDGSPTASLNGNYHGFTLYNDGVNKWFIE